MSEDAARPSLRHLPPRLPRPATATTVGVLHPDEHARHVALDRPPVDERLAAWVENYWTVRWDLPEGRTFRSEVVSHPAVHLTLEEGSVARRPRPLPACVVEGVVTGRFVLDLRGAGRVFGVKFRPGGFGAFTGRDVAALTDGWDDADAVVGGDVPGLVDAVVGAAEDTERARVVDAFLLARAPGPDERYERVLAIVEDLLADSALTSVELVCDRHDVGVRTLQRLFRRYVGVGPQWLVRRYRLHDAIAALDAARAAGPELGGAEGLADLAARLGWYDQAHFTRDFTALVGRTPAAYLRC